MDLYSLDSSWNLNQMVEGHTSFIWTERYGPCGDFVYTTPYITETMAKLPLESFVGMVESNEVMVVENYEVKTDENGQDLLTVSGRSFESFLENRTTFLKQTGTSSTTSPTFNTTLNATNAFYYNGLSDFVAEKTLLLTSQAANSIDTKDHLPTVDAGDIATPVPGVSTNRMIERGQAYEIMFRMLAEDNLGVRNDRTGIPAGVLQMYIYTGDDVSSTVIFDVNAGHFTSASYFWSIKDYYNTVYMATEANFVKVSAPGTSSLTGLARRVAGVDVTDITAGTANINNILTARGQTFLANHKKTVLFSGTVSPNAPYKYGATKGINGVNYCLGDTVWVQGKYGLSQKMQVTEFVRVNDENGTIAYPTLEAV